VADKRHHKIYIIFGLGVYGGGNMERISHSVQYRGYSILVAVAPPLWSARIDVFQDGLTPISLPPEGLRGWDEEEVVGRAKARIDLNLGKPRPQDGPRSTA
jgi:hypothetical protein